MYKLIIPTLCLSICAPVIASQPSYDFVQAGVVQTEVSELEVFDPKGFELKASVELGYKIFTEYKHIDTSDTYDGLKLEFLQRQVDVGYIHNVLPKLNLDYRLGYGNFRATGSNANESSRASTNYYSIATNVRYQLTPDLELFAGLEAQNWEGDADQKAYRLGAQYDLWGFLARAEYTKYSDQEIFGMSLRYEF